MSDDPHDHRQWTGPRSGEQPPMTTPELATADPTTAKIGELPADDRLLRSSVPQAGSTNGASLGPTRATRNAMIVSLAICSAGALSLLATISHGWEQTVRPIATAVCATLFGLVPPLLLKRMVRNAAAKQLLVVAWRLAVMLPALALAARFSGEERKWYLNTLLACYFVALPLESWLLIVDAKRPLKKDFST